MKKPWIHIAIGALITITVNEDSGHFLPWYLHLIVGVALLSYGTYTLFNTKEKNSFYKYLIPIWALVIIILIFRFLNTPKDNDYEANHPYANANEYSINFENGFEYGGAVKLNKDGILLIISKPNFSNIDSIHIKLDNVPLRDKQISSMCLLSEDEEPIHCSTGKDFISRKSEDIYSTKKLFFSYELKKGTDISNIQKIDLNLFNNGRLDKGSIIIE